MAAREVFHNMFSVDIDKDELSVAEKIEPENIINVSIGVTGDLKGTIIFSFSEKMALNLVEEMAGMEFNEFDKFVASAIGELANIISGNAMMNFSEAGYNCDIVPPQITVGRNKTFSTATKKVLVIPMLAAEKSFVIYISIRE